MPRRWINCRVIVRVCGLLLLGAVLTVAAAWGPAVWVRLLRDGNGADISAATNEELLWWRATVSPGPEHEVTEVIRPDRSGVGTDCSFMLSRGEKAYTVGVRDRFGLPLRSLGFYHWLVVPDLEWHSSWHWAFDVHRNGGFTTVTLPLTPIWPGFAVDTLFFAALSALILAGWRWMIRRRRLKRGRCPACNYPIGTSPVCTECGEPLPTVTARC